MTLQLDVVRVFTDDRGQHGNALGIVLDADVGAAGGRPRAGTAERQRIAAELGYSETIFVEPPPGPVGRVHARGSSRPRSNFPSQDTPRSDCPGGSATAVHRSTPWRSRPDRYRCGTPATSSG